MSYAVAAVGDSAAPDTAATVSSIDRLPSAERMFLLHPVLTVHFVWRFSVIQRCAEVFQSAVPPAPGTLLSWGFPPPVSTCIRPDTAILSERPRVEST